MLPETILLAVVVVLIVWIASVWVRAYQAYQADLRWGEQRGCQPPPSLYTGRWPLGLEVIIRAFAIAKEQKLLFWFNQTVQATGHTFGQDILGTHGIDTVEPRNIEAVLSTQFTEFSLGDRPPTFFPLLGDGIFTQDGNAWAHSRALLRPLFQQNREQSFAEIARATEKLLHVLDFDETVDLQPLFFRLTLDTTAFLLFGRSIGAIDKAVDGTADRESEFADAFDIGQDYLAQRGRIGGLYWIIDGLKFRRACKTVHSFIDEIVREALQSPSTGDGSPTYTMLEALIAETRNPIVLRQQLLNVLLAGRDTTACLLSWTFRLLARTQRVQSKLRSEITELLGSGASARVPTRADVKKLRYLDTVLKEVLRLYPSVPINSRAALKTTTLPMGGGPDETAPVLVRKGEAVGYCPYVMHRRTDLYGNDADIFRPERWEEDDGLLARAIGYGYLPFNGGPRVCLGQDFALLEASYVVICLLQAFPNMRLPEDEPLEPIGAERQKLTLVLSSADGCRVVLRDHQIPQNNQKL